MPKLVQLAVGVLCGTLALISTATGQRLVVDLNQTPPTTNPGSSPAGIWSLGATTVIAADDGRHGLEPWRSDGTAAGTALIADLVPGSRGSIVTFLSSVPAVGNGGLLFAVGGADNLSSLWRSDGTAAGTVKLHNFGPLAFGNPRYPTPVGNRVFFAADDGVSGLELWVTDGTPAGTALVADLTPGPVGSGVRNLAALGGDVCFIATPTTNSQLWRSDGTAAGTVMLHEFGPLFAPFEEVGRFVPFAGALYFVGWAAATGNELWRTDGTTAGTFLVMDVYPGTSPGLMYASTELVATAQALFFNATDGVTGNELWTSDGTTAGTRQVVDLHPSSASPRSLMPFGNKLLFVAIDTAHGQEPWITDGTVAGTRLIFDVRPGTGARARTCSWWTEPRRSSPPTMARAAANRGAPTGRPPAPGCCGTCIPGPRRRSRRRWRRTRAGCCSPPTTACAARSCGGPTARSRGPRWRPTSRRRPPRAPRSRT